MPLQVNKGTSSSLGEGAFLCSALPTYRKWELIWIQQAYLPASVCCTHFLLLFVFNCWSTVGKWKPQGSQRAKMEGHSPLVPTGKSRKYWYYNSSIRLVLAYVILQGENNFSVLLCNRQINFQRTKMPESVSNWHKKKVLPVMPAKPVKLVFRNGLPLSLCLNKFPFKRNILLSRSDTHPQLPHKSNLGFYFWVKTQSFRTGETRRGQILKDKSLMQVTNG